LPAQFDLDPQVIERAYFEKSKETHPDRFATAPAAERVVALSRSRAVNDAYKMIKNPIARAEYLLERDWGMTIGDNEQIPQDWLLPLLEEREELAEAIAAKQRARIEQLRAAKKQRRAQFIAGLPHLFATDPRDVKMGLITVRYWDRYIEQCDAALDEDEE
jgi:molecular chaperone HscB